MVGMKFAALLGLAFYVEQMILLHFLSNFLEISRIFGFLQTCFISWCVFSVENWFSRFCGYVVEISMNFQFLTNNFCMLKYEMKKIDLIRLEKCILGFGRLHGRGRVIASSCDCWMVLQFDLIWLEFLKRSGAKPEQIDKICPIQLFNVPTTKYSFFNAWMIPAPAFLLTCFLGLLVSILFFSSFSQLFLRKDIETTL